MKTRLLLSLCSLLSTSILFLGCEKQATQVKSDSPNVSFNEEVTTFESRSSDGSTTLTIRPGLKDGQDVNVLYFEDHPDQMDANFNYQNELETLAWTDGGIPLVRKSFIRFDSLVKIPATAHVISAKLYLYGLNSSHEAPQGNSYYPGSPYNIYGDNACYVERVVGGSWDENTITWNNQPLISQLNRTTLGPSTSQWGYNTAVDVTKLVRPMVAHPERNFGFRISLQSEEIYRSILFYTSEATDKTKRPKLVITYN